jgi:hypothetical protein
MGDARNENMNKDLTIDCGSLLMQIEFADLVLVAQLIEAEWYTKVMCTTKIA